MSHDCIFCKIISGEVPSAIIFQDERVTAFRDINPAAPTHILIVPNKHIASVEAVEEADESLIGYLYRAASRIAREEGISEAGYRLITNTGANAGQTVFHLHVHLLGGKMLKLTLD
ncbi:MAG: histidine triad nucleotide-binding protein [Anaerolineales bacterium]|nr:histidine triad nucleotide-binding protein [Anaerolineales bacterium]MCL4259525.1 histidine triad nucleotide-binding protein [Anaerolineales bacterium]